MRWTIPWLRAGLLLIGFACLAYVVTVVVQTTRDQARQNRALDEIVSIEKARPHLDQAPPALPNPDAAEPALAAGALVGRVEIARLGLAAVVRHGDDASTLKLAVGHLPGTARPGRPGNAVLAAHRDTFFRPLRNVQRGDEVVMTTLDGTYFYRVTKMHIVAPEDVWVMNPTEASILTLVTCYPFNYVGNAPKRFIVHATKIGEAVRERTAVGRASAPSSSLEVASH